jgi:prepilin-type N-terminal cleavage/methylation domain-containing protein
MKIRLVTTPPPANGATPRHAVRVAARAFSLVEILIVVVILGILAAIAVPKLSNASLISRESTLKEDLRFLRTQIGVYATHHRDVFPGFPPGNPAGTPTADIFVQQLTGFTDDAGNLASDHSVQYKWGPYLTKMPENPVNGRATITILGPGDAFTADGTTGWFYQPSTGTIEPNLQGKDTEGKNFSEY